MVDIHSGLQGKTCLITGATGGIGRITAEALARGGANVVIVGRSPAKTETAAAQIRKSTGSERVEFLLGDLSVQADVRRVAQEFRLGSENSKPHDRLHILINNAGAVFTQRHMSADDIEMTFALNHLAYFLLTNLLLDLLAAAAPARVINVSSSAHYAGKMHFEDLGCPRAYHAWPAYCQSKLANVLFTYELARRLQGSSRPGAENVTANALHPGFVATNFGISNGGFFKQLFRLAQFAAITPEQGASTTIYLASSPEVEGVSGKYFDRCKAVRSSAASYDLEYAPPVMAGKFRYDRLLREGIIENKVCTDRQCGSADTSREEEWLGLFFFR